MTSAQEGRKRAALWRGRPCITEDIAFGRCSPPERDAKGHAFPHTGPNPRGGRALPEKGRSPGSLSLLRPPSQDEERPSGRGRHCRAYSGGSAPVSHRTSRTPFEVPLSVFITIRKNTRLSNEEGRPKSADKAPGLRPRPHQRTCPLDTCPSFYFSPVG